MATIESEAGRRRALEVERAGIEVIPDDERRGRPRQLFWPWFGANVSVFGLTYGSFALGFGVSFWQAAVAGFLGIVFSFLLCGFIAVAGKRGSAPTMVLSRAAFGVRGNRVPALLSWLFTVGWETALVILATLGTATIFDRLGWASGSATKVIALLVVAALVIAGGVMGFELIMRMQTVITVVTAVLTVVYVAVVADKIDWHVVTSVPSGSTQNVVGCFVLFMTGFGIGWVNAAADYSRYLPRRTGSRGVIGWTTLGGAVAPVVLAVVGLLLSASSPTLSNAIGADPIGGLSTQLDTWALVPFLIVVLLGLVGGAVLDIYSSGLALLSAGVRIPRPAAALVDGVIMIAGSIYVVFFADSFVGPFQGFLVLLGVPVAAWCGVMLADVARRRRNYVEDALFDPHGRYGDVRPVALFCLVVGTLLGWGLVTSTANESWLTWQGYLLGPFGLGGKSGQWEFANLGVLVALVFAFVVEFALDGRAVRHQERSYDGSRR